ncbi:hypothetical protein VII00023_03788 [Vibrio ichthyoenteri ATCC 700023]|uniref:DUF3577 domain-containing protein n=1 Tax=Vibrio ichthyoenteri ATCC 700023 TaxID=870968 RepID=F9S5Y1_9VIBR|nr:DUF3577 domain-containing protein [Vibrio ichthyoenteri]EGU34605.1 hypothetical protein VII00023_03788 [Vibrio ichthyoenteri ATCC 700023]
MSGNNNANYFDIHTSAFGFINRVRKVVPNRGEPFWAADFSACRGDAGEKTYFDVKVVGTEANALFEQHLANFEQGKDKVTASIVIGDLRVELFTYKAGEKKGQTGVSLKGRLLRFKYLKVNDEVVLQTESEAQAA